MNEQPGFGLLPLSDLERFDSIEVAPVEQLPEEAATWACTRVEEEDIGSNPDAIYFWSVYGHIDGEGVECLGDFAEKQEAIDIGRSLYSLIGHLRRIYSLGPMIPMTYPHE
jgi:hypothetical protein